MNESISPCEKKINELVKLLEAIGFDVNRMPDKDNQIALGVDEKGVYRIITAEPKEGLSGDKIICEVRIGTDNAFLTNEPIWTDNVIVALRRDMADPRATVV